MNRTHFASVAILAFMMTFNVSTVYAAKIKLSPSARCILQTNKAYTTQINACAKIKKAASQAKCLDRAVSKRALLLTRCHKLK